MKQTAVKWLIQKIGEDKIQQAKIVIEWSQIFDQAMEQEREQLKDAYEWGRADEKNKQEDILAPEYDNADEFYQVLYGGGLCG